MGGSLKLVTAEGALAQGLRSPGTPMTPAAKAAVTAGGGLRIVPKRGGQVRALGSDQLLRVTVVARHAQQVGLPPAASAARTESLWGAVRRQAPPQQTHTAHVMPLSPSKRDFSL